MSCVFWQHDRIVTDERRKDAWSEALGREHGAFGRVLSDDAGFRGMIQYGPSSAFPARWRCRRGRPTPAAALVTCVFLEGDDLVGTAERLMLEALADLKGRGMRAVEAFALSYPDDVPVAGPLRGAPHPLRPRLPRVASASRASGRGGRCRSCASSSAGCSPARASSGARRAALRRARPSRTPRPPEPARRVMRTPPRSSGGPRRVGAARRGRPRLPAAAATTDASSPHRAPRPRAARQLGPGGADGAAELRAVAAELGRAGRPVKLAVVAGRGETRRLLAYARRLRDELGYEGTVVLTTPGGADRRRRAVVVRRGHRPDAPRPHRADRRPRSPARRPPRRSPPWSRRRPAGPGPP